MNLDALREVFRTYLTRDLVCGHKDLSDRCVGLGLASPPSDGIKADRLKASLAATPADALPGVAERLLQGHERLSIEVRRQLEELLWSAKPCPAIPLRVRRELAQGLEIEQLFRDGGAFLQVLEQYWVLETDLLTDFIGWQANGLRQKVERHVLQNPGDWSVEDLFTQLGALEASDARFGRFLETLVSHRAQQEEPRQRNLAGRLNRHLRSCAAELREADTDGGYPVFALVSTHPGAHSRPKQLIFASSEKPDLRLRDAVSNDIEVVTHADKVLIYDRPVERDGLTWGDLQAWWSDLQGIPNDAIAKRTLWDRLLSCLPENSPPQRFLFLEFYRAFGPAVAALPALLPEVWLHWDPKTKAERGNLALPRFRMDFLLLLPGGYRVVIEVDGKQHYADPSGRASPWAYAKMMKADRDLRLAGYEVFRFGAAELESDEDKQRIHAFFRDLFRKYRVEVPPGIPSESAS